MELSGNNNRLDWRRVVAVALAGRHYLVPWFDDPDDLVGLIRDPWVGGRPFLPDGLPVIDRVPGHDNAFAATGHGMLGVTLGPVTGHRLAEFVRTGRRPEELTPFRFDRLRGRLSPRRGPAAASGSRPPPGCPEVPGPGSALVRRQPQRDAVDAVPLVGRGRIALTFEHVSEM